MKQLLLATILLLSGLAAVPGAQASEAAPPAEAWVPCPQEPGYRVCSFETEDCHGDVRYYQHDSFFTYSVACQVGNLHCSYYSHSLYGYQVGHNCHIVSEAAASDAQTDAAPTCQKEPGYRDCTVSAGGCTVGFRYYDHDGYFQPVAHCIKAASADSPVQCHGPLDGFQYCTVDAGECQAGEVYERGNVHAFAECQPTDGKSVCGVDAYSSQSFDLSADYHCMGREGQLLPLGVNAAAQPCTLDHDVAPGYVNVDLDCGRLLNCHINNIEDSTRTCSSETAGCTAEALGVELQTQYADCPDAATTTASTSGTGCQQYPGYERCDYAVGPCTVTTYYFYHDAFYVVDGPHCDKPRVATANAESGSGCQDYPGYTRCEYTVGPCTVTTTHYHHDGLHAVEVCGLVSIDQTQSAASGTAASSADGSFCQEYPGYERCDYTAGPCTVTTYYFYHDAFYRVDRPTCEKPGVAAASSPVQCWGLDGLLACEVEAGPCHAGFRYENPEVEDVHAQCF